MSELNKRRFEVQSILRDTERTCGHASKGGG